MKEIYKPVLIFIDNLRRDYLVAEVIKVFLEKKNFKVFLVSRENLKKSLKFIKPDLVVFIKNYFQEISKNILNEINEEADIIFIDAEGSQTLDRCKFFTERYKINVLEQTRRARKIFLWNSEVKDYLQNYTKENKEKFFVSGSPKINLSLLAKDLIKIPNQKSIGFIGRFVGINTFDGRSCLENSSKNFLEHDEFMKGARGEIDSLFIYLEIIDYVIKNTDLIINFRPHPNEKISSYNFLKEKYKNRFIISDPHEDFINWMFRQEKIICTPSTSIVEVILNDIPIISIHKMIKESSLKIYVEEMLMPFLTKVNAPENFEELVKMLNVDFKNKIENNNFYLSGRNKSYGDGNKIKIKSVEEIFEYFSKNYKSKKINFFYYLKILYLITNLKSFLKFKFFNFKHLMFTNDYNYFMIKNNTLGKKIVEKILINEKN